MMEIIYLILFCSNSFIFIHILGKSGTLTKYFTCKDFLGAWFPASLSLFIPPSHKVEDISDFWVDPKIKDTHCKYHYFWIFWFFCKEGFLLQMQANCDQITSHLLLPFRYKYVVIPDLRHIFKWSSNDWIQITHAFKPYFSHIMNVIL